MKLYLKIIALLGYILSPLLIKLNRKIIVEKKIKVKGFPILIVKKKSRIYLGNKVFLNSSNYGYHMNMNNPVKLFANGENAVIRIGKNTRIHGSCIHARKKVIIGDNCLIAANCQIVDSNGHLTQLANPEDRINTIDKPRSIIIKNNVWIGGNSYILKGVTIGEGSVVSAGSVVNRSIPPNVIVMGNPAKVIKELV